MRNSRSSLTRLITLAIPLWALSACFSAPEPPAVFAPPEDASVTNEPDDSEDTGSTAVEDVTEPDGDVTTDPGDVTEPEDVTEPGEDVITDPEDVATDPEDVTADPGDVTADPGDVAPPLLCGDDPEPPNTCVDWTCSGGAWTAKSAVSKEGDTCDSDCYPGSGALTCHSGQCRPPMDVSEECANTPPGNPCVVMLCNHDYGTCGDLVTTPGASCDDGDACTETDLCNSQGDCEGTPKSCSEGATDCAGPPACDPATGECVGAPVEAGTTCDDGELDTLDDVCDGEGECYGTPCAPAAACWLNNADGNQCNPELVADGEACGPGLPCISGTCDGAGGCHTTVVEGSCFINGKCVPDGQKVPEDMCLTCDASEAQTEGAVTNCDDNDPCTVDSCDPEAGICSHVITPIPNAADPCDGIDNNCDGLTDEDWTQEYCGPAIPGGSCTKVGDPNPSAACETCTLEGEVASFTSDPDDTPCTATCIPDGQCAAGQCEGEQDTSDINCSCCVSHYPASPGCSDPEAEQAICNHVEGDPFCCSTEGNWDDSCAQKATQQNYCGPTICADGVCNIQEALAGTGDNSCEDLDCSGDIQCTTHDQCDDDNPCTVDVCNDIYSGFDTKCTHLPAEVVGQTAEGCDDGDPCNGAPDQCVMGVCTPAEGGSVSCDDQDVCTTDSCDPETGECSHESASTDDVEVCDGVDNNCDGEIDEGFKTDSCSPDVMGEACPGLGAPKADNPCLICTAEAGEGADAGWALADNGTECDDGDGNSCTTGACTVGVCGAGPDVDSVGCSCCVSNAEVTPGCNDNDIEGSVCALDPHCCETNWDDDCAQLASLQNACGPTACDDELANMDEIWGDLDCETPDYGVDDCNHDSDCGSALEQPQTETCGIAVCSKVWERACDGDDDVDCGAGSPFSGQCTHLPAEVVGQTPGTCDDGDACNGVEDPCVMGVCTPAEGGSVDCDDDVECTVDSCSPADGCEHVATDTFCGDGIDCTQDTCDPSNGCGHVPIAATCNDSILCTVDSCDPDDGDPDSGCVYTPNDGYCNDDKPCTIDLCDAQAGCSNELEQNADAEVCDGLDNNCDGTTDEGSCDDNDECTDDSCNPDVGCVFSTIEGCADLECTLSNPAEVDPDCDYVGCQGTCDSNSCTYEAGSLCDSLCTLESNTLKFEIDVMHNLAEEAYPHGPMVVHKDVLYVPVNEGYSEMGGGDGGFDEPTFEIFRYDISNPNAAPDMLDSWLGSDFGLSGQAGPYSVGEIKAMQGRDDWLDIAFTQMMVEPVEGSSAGASICSVNVSASDQDSVYPEPEDCYVWQDPDANSITTLAKSPGFVLAGVATYELPSSSEGFCFGECSAGLVCVDNQCTVGADYMAERNYIVSLVLNESGEITGDEADRIESGDLFAATGAIPNSPSFFAPSDIAVDHPTNGAATRIIVAGRIRKSPADNSYDSYHANLGGVVLFGNLEEDGSFDFTNSASYFSSKFGEGPPTAKNNLQNYEPVQVIVDRRAGRSIAYVLWSPNSAFNLYCDSAPANSSTTDPYCETVLTAHDLTQPEVGWQAKSPVYDAGGEIQNYPGQMAMSLLGSPVGKTRLAIGAGGLFSVHFTYQASAGEELVDVSTWSPPNPQNMPYISQSAASTLAIVQTDSVLIWLNEVDLDAPTKVSVYEPACEAQSN